MRSVPFLILLVLAATAPLYSQTVPPFFPGGAYDPAVPEPRAVLGFGIGERPARAHQVAAYLDAVAAVSPRVKLLPMGTTYEGRALRVLVIASPENLARLEEIKAANARLGDPRRTSAEAARAGAATQPLIAWAEYAIHGDEISSVDAALQVIYQLAAGTDETTRSILANVVVCIDPMVNPDGRERFLGQMEQWNGVVPNPDIASLHHTGSWPGGRGNHYLFDMNRDWFILAHPEMRERVGTIIRWNPQLMIDSHEMGSTDTYLFHPPREPLNAHISPVARTWWPTFARDQAKAFDRYGWSYYTREWNDDFYPGYGASWILYTSAIGILYEQAGVDGTLARRPDGTTLTYRETVHHHFTSTIANLATAAHHREAILADFAADRRRVTEDPDAVTFYIVPGPNRARLERFIGRMQIAGIEIHRLTAESAVRGCTGSRGERIGSKTFPAGTIVIPSAQPMGRFVRAILEFDPRMTTAFLQEERKSLEKESETKLYDVTAWSLLLANNFDAYVSREKGARIERVETLRAPEGGVANSGAPYGYLMEFADDRSQPALVRMLEAGLTVRSAKEPFSVEGKAYGRGSFLLRNNENPPSLSATLAGIAKDAGVRITGVGTALTTAGPDLGGNDMVLLRALRPALVGGPEFDGSSFGALWQLLDYRLGMRTSILNAQQLGYGDLRKYNVLLLPSADPGALQRVLGKAGIGRLREWMEGGGTLIAIGGAAAFAADTGSGLSAVRLRAQALKDLPLYSRAADWERESSKPVIDSVSLWEGTIPRADTATMRKEGGGEALLAQQEERARLFGPRGAILRAELDEEFWLAFGEGTTVPVLISGSTVLLARDPVRTAARLSGAATLRMSGLLWPEARDRLARSAYATRERKGRGQLILFAGQPNLRASFEGSERLLLNAILLGPGFGTSAPIDW
jgi:hypothetical protein